MSSGCWFGAGLVLDIGEEEIERYLQTVLVAGGGCVVGHKLASISVSNLKHVYGVDRDVSDRTMRDIVRRSVAGKVGSLQATDRRLDPNTQIEEAKPLWVNIDVGRQLFNVQLVYAIGPASTFHQDKTLDYLRMVAKSFTAYYGCVTSGASFFRVLTRMSYNMHAAGDDYKRLRAPDRASDPVALFFREIGSYKCRMQMFRECIPRAEWGTILSSVHIDALGGEERIRRESMCYLVERWGANLYLQLTDSLCNVSCEKLIRLNEYLKAIRFADAPESVYL